MAGFLTPLRVERINGGNRWRILEPFEYHIGHADSGVFVRVPTGFETDFASIPRGLWNLFPPVGGTYDKAAVVHDYLYRTPVLDYEGIGFLAPMNRRFVDTIFLEAMQVLGVGPWTRYTLYGAVRVGGWKPWNAYRALDTPDRS